MARRCETLLLVMVVSIGCRRPAPPPPPASATPISAAPVASTPAAEPPASSGPAPQGLVDEAAKIEAAKNKEASPGKSASSGGERHAPSAGGARTRAARVAEESLQPKAKEHRTHEAEAEEKTGGEEGKVVAAREEVAAAPESPAQAQVHTTLRFKNEAGPNYKLVEARFVMDGTELPMVITTAQRGETQQVFSGQVPAGHHVVESRLTYQGADRAIFSYMKGYTFRVKSEDGFVAGGKNAVSMTIVCKEKTGFNEPIERRLFVAVE